MLSLTTELEALVHARRRAITEDDEQRVDNGKHARYGGARVVADVEADAFTVSGGTFNSSDPVSAMYGVTKADAQALVRAAAKLGLTLSLEAAQALLFEATEQERTVRACLLCEKPILGGGRKFDSPRCRNTYQMRRKRARKGSR